MSTLKVNKLRDTSGSTDAITLDPNGGAVLAGVTTVTTVKAGVGVTITTDGINAVGAAITCANINENQIGGRRNFFMNGAMQVHQRNTSITVSGSYGIDRWWLAHSNTSTMARSTTVPSGEGFDYSLKVSNISGGDAAIGQPIELTAAGKQGGLASGKKITFSFYGKCDSGTDGISVICNFRESKYSATNQVSFTGSGTGVTLTTTWTRFVVTMTIPTCHSGSTMAAFELNGISGTSHFTGFQVEIGEQATPFEHHSLAEELALCQRYFLRLSPATSYAAYGVGGAYSNTQAVAQVHFPVPMRASPTFSYNGALNTFYDVIGGFASFSAMTVSQIMGSSIVGYTSVKVNVVGSGTAGNTFMLATFANVNTYLNFDSEF